MHCGITIIRGDRVRRERGCTDSGSLSFLILRNMHQSSRTHIYKHEHILLWPKSKAKLNCAGISNIRNIFLITAWQTSASNCISFQLPFSFVCTAQKVFFPNSYNGCVWGNKRFLSIMKCIIGEDETWMYAYNPEAINLSVEYRRKGEARPKNPRQSQTKVKGMSTIIVLLCTMNGFC